MHLNFGKFDAARAIFAPIHDSFDQYLDATNNLAICCMGQGDETLATSLLQGVLMKDRCHLEAVNNYAVLLMRQHKFTYAAQLLEDAVTQDRRFSSLWNNLGVAYKHMGLYKEATKAFSKACRLEQNPTYSRLLELNLAASLVQFCCRCSCASVEQMPSRHYLLFLFLLPSFCLLDLPGGAFCGTKKSLNGQGSRVAIFYFAAQKWGVPTSR